MQSTRVESQAGRRRAGLRIAPRGLVIPSLMTVLVLAALGSGGSFSTQAGALERGDPEKVAPDVCGPLSFLAAVNYGVGLFPFSVAAADLN